MSILRARVADIESVDGLHIVTFELDDTRLKMVSLGLDTEVKQGRDVMLQIKPSSVAIAKNIQGELSYSNQIKAVIKSIKQGRLLCSIKLLACANEFESIITTSSLLRLKLKIGDEITALIKANELAIARVIDV